MCASLMSTMTPSLQIFNLALSHRDSLMNSSQSIHSEPICPDSRAQRCEHLWITLALW